MSNKLRAACYVRVSCASDLTEGSYETQENYFRKMIEEDENLELVECYGDYGISGGEAITRPGFQVMLKDAENGKFDVLYTKSVSRFSRNITHFCDAINRLRKCGVNVYFEKENLQTADRSSELVLHIVSAVADEELRSIRENVRLGLEARVSTGHPVGTVAYGFIRINKDAEWGINESEAKRIKLMFRMAGSGNCYQDILKALNQLEQEEGTGVEWKSARLHDTLTSIVYKGNVQTVKSYVVHDEKKRVVSNKDHKRKSWLLQEHHAPIVTTELFDRVQSLMSLGLLNSHRVNFTEEEKTMMSDDSWRADQDRLEAEMVFTAPEDRYRPKQHVPMGVPKMTGG